MTHFKKAAFFALSSVLLLALSLVIKPSSPDVTAEEPAPYTVSLTSEDPALINPTTYGSGTKTVGYVTFDYYLAKDVSGRHTELNTSGYIQNSSSTQITSITQIEGSFTGNVKLEVGFDYGTVSQTVSPWYSSTKVLFTDNPYFFRITVLSGVMVLNSLTISYSCVPTPAAPTYTFVTDHYVVSGYTKRPQTVIIPSTYNGYPVTEIGSGAFMNASTLTSITIPSSVTVIGDGAFANCVSLGSITLPDISFIGSGLFYNCPSLMSITIPSTVTSIAESAFYGCTGLTSITIPSGVTSLGLSAFETCTNLATISGGSGLTTIGRDAFTGTPWLAAQRSGDSDKVILKNGIIIDALTATGAIDLSSETITKVSDGAFAGTSVTSVILPEGVTYIGEYAFHTVSSLTTFPMPTTVTTIGKGAFSGCSGLTAMTLPSGIASLGDETFYYCINLDNIVIPSSVTHIGSFVFRDCYSLAHLTVPSSINSLGEGPFLNTPWLTAQRVIDPLVILNGLFLIDAQTVTTENVTLPSGLTRIGYGAFQNNSSVKNITIPSGVTTIDAYAFSGCSELLSVTIPESVTSIGARAFEFCEKITSLTFPSGITRMEEYVLFDCIGLTSFVIPAGVTYIGWGAFSFCTGLTQIIIPDGVTEIDYQAFSQCTGLTSVVIPLSVTTIKNYTFDSCSSLTTIYHGGLSTGAWSSVTQETYAFNGAATHTVYPYSEENAVGYWHFASGVPTLWS